MECPNCEEDGTLEWKLTFCTFECENCGESFTICDLVEAGEI